jgi:hypothetical protein
LNQDSSEVEAARKRILEQREAGTNQKLPEVRLAIWAWVESLATLYDLTGDRQDNLAHLATYFIPFCWNALGPQAVLPCPLFLGSHSS